MTAEQLASLVKDPGFFGLAIVRPFGLILLWIYEFVQNYGLTVIIFALLVKLICIPLSIKSKKSMMAMTAVNAELQQLQKKYANNRVKLNEEMQKPVSYTHLDVYKRQPPAPPALGSGSHHRYRSPSDRAFHP